MMSSSKERHSRLGWVELHILLALGDADLHGYAIMQKVSHDTSGRIRLGAGTLYGAIKRLTAARLIAVAPQRKTTDQRRVCYRILAAGREALREELQHIGGSRTNCPLSRHARSSLESYDVYSSQERLVGTCPLSAELAPPASALLRRVCRANGTRF